MGVVKEEDWVFLPEEAVLSAKGIVQTYHDYWWCVHPEKGLRFFQPLKRRRGQLKGAAPKCNKHKTIAERFCPQGDGIKCIPLVLVPIEVGDYAS